MTYRQFSACSPSAVDSTATLVHSCRMMQLFNPRSEFRRRRQGQSAEQWTEQGKSRSHFPGRHSAHCSTKAKIMSSACRTAASGELAFCSATHRGRWRLLRTSIGGQGTGSRTPGASEIPSPVLIQSGLQRLSNGSRL